MAELLEVATATPGSMARADCLVGAEAKGEVDRLFPSQKEGEQETRKRRRLVKRSKTPTFLLELPLSVDAGQAKRLRAHFEAARCLYNALLGEAMKRLRAMRADPA